MAETKDISRADQMEDLKARLRPGQCQGFHAVCIAGHAEMQAQRWEVLCSTLGGWAKGRAWFHKGCPARAQLRSAQSPAGHSCQGSKPRRGWTVTAQEIKHRLKGWNSALTVQDGESWFSLKVWKFWRVPFFQSTINCFLTVTLRSFPLVFIIFHFPRKVTNLLQSGICILLLVSFKKNKETYYHHSFKSLSCMGFGFVAFAVVFIWVWFGGAFCCQAKQESYH